MINMLKNLLEKINNMQEQMGSVSRQKLKIRRICKRSETLKRNAFDRFISGLEVAKERVRMLEDMSIKIFQTEMQREKEL